MIANSGLLRPSFAPGIRVASRRILRIGVALLGIRLSLGVVGDLGLRTIVVIVGSIVLTFVGDARDGPHPRRLGAAHAADRDRHGHLRRLRDRGHGGGQRGDREEAAFALATVTALGTVAMVGLPFLRTPVGLDMTDYGIWSGASVHEVAQVVGATAGVSAVALKIGTLVKLARVALLAPLVLRVRRSRAAAAVPRGRRSCRSSSSASSRSRRCARPTSSPTTSSPT